MTNFNYPQLTLEAARAVYYLSGNPTGEKLQTLDALHRFTDYRFITADYSEALVADSPHLLLIAIRGTDEWQEWFNNFLLGYQHNLYDLVSNKNVHVHSGFENRTYSLLTNLEAKLTEEQLVGEISTKKDVLLTGHSVGGAMAALIAFWSASKWHLPTFLYGYGTPRVGDINLYKELREQCKEAVFYEHQWDIIPKLPPHYPDNPLVETVNSLRNPFDLVGNHLVETYVELMAEQGREAPQMA